ncbi:hypothetical protein AAGS61_05750 [Lysinibacillus sp. KU-BSD001]|uniref:hypothetical protein n=1 Tax=Lysinibacillus sp. KU-BSD001 TaxID=3141328 RepID=UPI0036E6CD5B
MSIDFNKHDLLLIYGHFSKKIKKLELLKSMPDNPIDLESINQEIELFTSITSKIEEEHPSFLELKAHI